jgi:endonuclease/exonuclease/phosphatase family metal-dependent hydrolase
MKKFFLLFLLIFSSIANYSQGTDTLKVMSYNLLKFPFENSGRISLIESIMAEARPDILMVCELTSSSGANGILNNALNQNGVTSYAMANYIPGPDTENMLYYNSNKLSLLSQTEIPTDLRDINEYVLYYNSLDIATTADTTFFHVYVCHLKAGQGDSTLRNEMALDLKEYLATKSNLENVIFGGDFNIYTSQEPVWNTVLFGSGVILKDPINMPGNWNNNSSFSSIHTQSTRTTSIDGGATGGMDDRFDLIFISPDLENWGAQAKYIDGSYWAYGQDGLHFNSNLIDAPTNTALPTSIIQDLYYMSDHLPVYMEIEVQKSFNSISSVDLEIETIYSQQYQKIELSSIERFIGKYVSIYDLQGKILKRVQLSGNPCIIDVHELAEGIYFLGIEGYNYSFKFKK